MHPAEAARLAESEGRRDDAARLFAEAGMSYEAAVHFWHLGELESCLHYLVRVSRKHERYRSAAATAVRIAKQLGVLDLQLDQFLSDFIASGPENDRELETFQQLGALYLEHNQPDSAEEVLELLVERSPAYGDAAALLESSRSQQGESRMDLEQVLHEDSRFYTIETGKGPVDAASGNDPISLSGIPLPTPPPAPLDEPGARRPGTLVLPTGAPGTGFEVGSTIANRYRVDELIGRGGMAMVFRASDLELGEAVALKVFTQPASDESALGRFRQELKLSRLLVHPNIVRLYDIGVYQGFRYISMELLVGSVLDELLGEPLDLRRGLNLLLQACSALELAHEKGIVHRDLKPGNLFVTRDGTIKVMDFGIAKLGRTQGLTAIRTLAGTPEYISPEQIDDFSTVTAAADLYALGAIAYEIFTGRRPFDHPELMPLLRMHLERPPEPPRRLRPQIPESLEDVVLKLLEKRAEDRFDSCRALAAELARIQSEIAASQG